MTHEDHENGCRRSDVRERGRGNDTRGLPLWTNSGGGGSECPLTPFSTAKKRRGSVVEGAKKGDTLLDPNALISLRRDFDVRHKIRRVTRR